MAGRLFRVDTDRERVHMRCTRCKKVTRFAFRTLAREEQASACPRCGYDGYRIRWDHARKMLADMGLRLCGETAVLHFEGTGEDDDEPDQELHDLR